MIKIKALFWFVIFAIFVWITILADTIIMPIAAVCSVVGRGKIQQWGINCYEGLDNYKSAQSGGDPDESISSRLGKAKLAGSAIGTYFADKVDLVAKEIFKDNNHSLKSIEVDEGRKQVTKY